MSFDFGSCLVSSFTVLALSSPLLVHCRPSGFLKYAISERVSRVTDFVAWVFAATMNASGTVVLAVLHSISQVRMNRRSRARTYFLIIQETPSTQKPSGQSRVRYPSLQTSPRRRTAKLFTTSAPVNGERVASNRLPRSCTPRRVRVPSPCRRSVTLVIVLAGGAGDSWAVRCSTGWLASSGHVCPLQIP